MPTQMIVDLTLLLAYLTSIEHRTRPLIVTVPRMRPIFRDALASRAWLAVRSRHRLAAPPWLPALG